MINTDLDDQFIEEYEKKLKSQENNEQNHSYISSQINFDERVNTDIINSNQIQNLYNYIIKIKEKNRALNIKCQGLEMMKNNNDDKNMKHRENEEYIKMILIENNKLQCKTEEYKIQLSVWEKNLNEIMTKLNKLEEENKRLFNDNKLLKSKNNEILGQFKLFKDKEASYDCAISNLKKENTDKIKNLDDKLNHQIKQLEFEYKQKVEKMTIQLKEYEKKNSKVKQRIIKLVRENKVLIEQFSESDKFFKSKETEFERITNLKDEKLKELENYLSSLSNEIENQNLKIKKNLNDHFVKEEQLKKYIFQIENQIEILKKKLNEKEKIIKFLEEKISVLIPTASFKFDYNNISNY